MKLTTEQQWESRWSQNKKENLPINPTTPLFRERHEVFQRIIPSGKNKNVLEVGAYPGTYLRYFYEYFNYQPWGVEYVKSCAEVASKLLEKEGVPASIINQDFFSLEPREFIGENGWDLTVSFGFVEHFTDSYEAVAKHIEVTRPGGYIILSIPNHAGMNGWIAKKVNHDIWKQHNLMSLSDLVNAVIKAGGTDIVFSGYVGHFGFWSAGLYTQMHSRLGKFYSLLRTPLWILEHVGQWLIPNNRWTSPDSLVIARKNNHSK